VTKLDYTFTYDTLFKMLFVRRPDLLRRLVAAVLDIAPENMEELQITNPEIPPQGVRDKFCRLDINMVVNGDKVSLEVQISNGGDYRDRSLYYWAREFSSALEAGGRYSELPRVVIISILDFMLFDCHEYHSEFKLLESARHECLTQKILLHYLEVRKLPETVDGQNELEALLSLFKAKTEEDLKRLEALEVPIVTDAIKAYREVTVSPEFKELERLRERARHNEASALYNAERKGEQQGAVKEREKWQRVVADKDASLAAQAALIAELRAQLG
jgi:predicted transposase/invertase (TIGR01784 family)